MNPSLCSSTSSLKMDEVMEKMRNLEEKEVVEEVARMMLIWQEVVFKKEPEEVEEEEEEKVPLHKEGTGLAEAVALAVEAI